MAPGRNDWSILDETGWLGVYGLLTVAAVGLIGRLALQAGRVRRRRPPLSEYALAYLAGRHERMVYAGLAALHASGSLTVGADSSGRAVLRAAGTPAGADPVEHALCHALWQGVEPARLVEAPEVTRAAEVHIDQLRRDGLLLSGRRRRTARVVGVVGGLSAVLVGTIFAVLGVILLVAPVGERSIVAARALGAQRRRHRMDPIWLDLGPAGARRTVALHGEVALVVGDPDLAHALGVSRKRPPGRPGDGD